MIFVRRRDSYGRGDVRRVGEDPSKRHFFPSPAFSHDSISRPYLRGIRPRPPSLPAPVHSIGPPPVRSIHDSHGDEEPNLEASEDHLARLDLDQFARRRACREDDVAHEDLVSPPLGSRNRQAPQVRPRRRAAARRVRGDVVELEEVLRAKVPVS